MKKQILPSLLLIAIMVFFVSCKKESMKPAPVTPSTEVVQVKISPNQTYQADMNDATKISIAKQAIHFSVSEALVSGENGAPGYKYVPAADFTGSDEVTLISSKTETSYFSGGCSTENSNEHTTVTTKYITLKITVGN
jgi:hypothetical protein